MRFMHLFSCTCSNLSSDIDAFDKEINMQFLNSGYKDFLYKNFFDDTNTQQPNAPKDATKKSWKHKRNFIAHFNYLTQPEKSILTIVEDVRTLVRYDRKLKNAVTKSFITLLDRHGINIEFYPLHEKNHQLSIKSIKPKLIKHLGGQSYKQGKDNKVITTNQVSPEYVDMVHALLVYPNKIDPA